jgi:hypothetical protein
MIRKLPEVRSREGLWDGLNKLRITALYVDYEDPTAPMSIEKNTADFILSFAGSWGNSLADLILESAHELFPDRKRSKSASNCASGLPSSQVKMPSF